MRGVKGLIFERTRRLDKRTHENCEKIGIFLICDSRVELQLKEGGQGLDQFLFRGEAANCIFNPNDGF